MKYLEYDDQVKAFYNHDELKDYLKFRKENDEWIEVFINEMAAVGIQNIPLFIPKYCTDIKVHKNGFLQELPDIDFEKQENKECIEATGLFLAFPYKGKISVMPTREIAFTSIVKRAADDCGTMLRFESSNTKNVLPINEKAERLTRDFALYSDTCKILIRDEKISAVLSKSYAILPADELIELLEKQLATDHPMYTFDKGQVSHEYLMAEYLINDPEMEESFRLALNDAGGHVKTLKAGIRFSTSDVGMGKVYATLFYDANGTRMALSGRIELEHDGDSTTDKFKTQLQDLGIMFKESEEQIELLGNTDIADVAETVRKITDRFSYFPRAVSDEVISDLSRNYPNGGTGIDVYLALNEIIQRHAAKNDLSPTRYLNLCEQVAKLMRLPFAKIDAGEEWEKN